MIKSRWHVGESPNNIERQVNRIELNVSQCMQQHRPAFGRGHLAQFKCCRTHQLRKRGTTGAVRQWGRFNERASGVNGTGPINGANELALLRHIGA